MTDIRTAVENLAGHSICLCKDGVCITDDGRGISPMMRFLAEGRDLNGFSAADVIVGKATAMLFVKAGITEVYGKVMSRAAAAFLSDKGILYSCGELTQSIINRAGTGLCPMEMTVAEIEDVEKAYTALRSKLAELAAERRK